MQKVTIITPTTGKNSLFKLIESLDRQTVPFTHILLWDSKREDRFLYPNPETLKVENPCFFTQNGYNVRYSIAIEGNMVQGIAAGSSLRAVGLMAASTDYVTFADDDVWFEDNHLENMLKLIEGKNWCYGRRKIWFNDRYLGVDNFESVGDSAERKVPYEMVDNNCMMFKRRFGSSGACLYRETQEYNDDRLFYVFLKKHAGEPSRTNLATVNQVCPARLSKMFEENCAR